MKRRYSLVIGLLALIVVAFLGGTILYKTHTSNSHRTTSVEAENAAAYTPTAGKPGTKTFTIMINENKIVGPKTIKVARGDAVHFVFKGDDDQEEGDVLISGYNLTVPTTQHYTSGMEFKALKSGTFPITLTYEDESREVAEQHDELLGGTEETEMHTATIGSFIVTK